MQAGGRPVPVSESVHRAHGHTGAAGAAVAAVARAAEDVETVDEVYHAICVDGVVPRVAAHRGVDDARHVALLVEDVVELQAERGGFVLEEALGDLRVPDQLVRVHGVVRIPAAGGHLDVGGDAHAPVEVHVGIGAVGEVPSVHVGVLLERGAGVLVTEPADKPYVEHVRAVGQVEMFVDAEGTGRIFARAGRAEQPVVVVVRVQNAGFYDAAGRTACVVVEAADITHGVAVVDAREGGYGERLVRTESGVEHVVAAGVPIAVDVFGPGVAHAGALVVDDAVAHGVLVLGHEETGHHHE